MNIDIEALKPWIGRSETHSDWAASTPLRALAAVLDREDSAKEPGPVVPPCWHWLYFLPLSRQSEMGPDGHPHRGSFLPPVPLPRRMWAGSRIEWQKPLRIGQSLTMTSCIVDVSVKRGRTGPLVFVRVRREIGQPAGQCLVEEQDIVYRDVPTHDEPVPPDVPAPVKHDWERAIEPDPVLLFRYSALTFNGHRIHYDRRYSTETEGYPGLVVQGPLIATLLLDLLRRNLPDAHLVHFAFRAVKPTFDLEEFRICGARSADRKSVHLWAGHADGALAMDAIATLA